MGNTLYSAAPQSHIQIIAAENTWLEGKAIQQLETTAQLPDMVRVVGLPDLHPGRGYPVGAAFFSQSRFYPALIGNDIGCGMALWKTDLVLNKWSLDKLEKKLGSIDNPLEEDELPENMAEYFCYSPGTIGGGNHFAELQQIDEIYQPELLETWQLNRQELLLLVHSGSRGMGQMILEQHVRQYGHKGLEASSVQAQHYLQQHQQALDYAHLNRQLIAERMLGRWRAEGSCLLDVSHNLLTSSVIDGIDGWLHRKGATPSDQGLVVIPGSRGDYSYLVEPVATEQSLFSLAHGAGRKWGRNECKSRLAGRYNAQQLSRTALGSRVVCLDNQLIFQEAPEAYKPISGVMDAMVQTGLVKLVARLKPVLTYKTRKNQE
ncbi:RNA ligase RtcB family protein [Xenorhabdus sp. PB30.3]|uniref:RNA ligase RtcB family protein n=1 Tax=Xenorhabdus sp. PB30.3 TaxID=2788941 RepID=UPI001E4F072F|nr:RNA ligase RtcB family protein [Xenorhabdus sp. PB30.3]MCC8381056.1 RNA ligase RtcB family protein [Xenorhabdus sp. PB30.3]